MPDQDDERRDGELETPGGLEDESTEELVDDGLSLEQEIERLSGELDARIKEAEQNYARFLRACADLENYKKRAEKEKADFLSFANEGLILDLLPVVDNLERAIEHTTPEAGQDALVLGVRLTIDQFYGALKKYGLTPINAVNEKFDPAIHHAISHDEASCAPADTVVKEFQKGYALKGKVIRHSMVSVAKGPKGE